MLLVETKFGNSDGVISPADYEKYNGAKILWILKEPYGKGGCNQANEKERAAYPTDIWENKNVDGYHTFAPMILLAHILAGGAISDDVLYSKSAFEHFKRSTAYVNVKKIPGTSSSSDSVIQAAAKENKELINRQINLYSPTVIIGGGTLKYFFRTDNFAKRDSVFEELKILKGHDCGRKSKLEGIDAIEGLGDRISVSLCEVKTIKGEEFGVYPGNRFLFIDAAHPSSIYGKGPNIAVRLKASLKVIHRYSW